MEISMKRDVILTGLRANNDLHIGNYFGALLPMIDMAKSKAEEYEINLFVPDLHSFTTPIDHSKLQEQIRHNLRIFAAAGLPLNHPNVHIYRQSRIPAHSELTVILNSFTGMGQMARMTQYKDKSAKLGDEQISIGLFDYPVLMAADILLYGAKYVPVGEDQTQHLEFTRDIAERMNSRFGELFVVPEPVQKQHEFFGKDQGLRIKDLVDPSKKMSKSDDTGKGCIFLGDSPEEAAKKVMSATTDSVGSILLDYEGQPGISNLLQMLALLTNRNLSDVVKEHAAQERYGDFKAEVAEAIKAFLTDFQAKLAAVNDDELFAAVETNEAKMRDIANQTLMNVQTAIGLR
jgi:tryptophanyl-tRNA synthetase